MESLLKSLQAIFGWFLTDIKLLFILVIGLMGLGIISTSVLPCEFHMGFGIFLWVVAFGLFVWDIVKEYINGDKMENELRKQKKEEEEYM